MRYDGYGSIDDKPIVDGDEGFLGLNTTQDPTQLPNGVVSMSKNMRLQKGVAETRNGTALFMDNLDSSGVVSETILDGISYGTDTIDDDVLVACSKKAFRCNPVDGKTEVSYPDGYPEISNAFLLDTRANTLLFSDPGPTLPFQLNATLGNPVLRLADGETKFKRWKECDVSLVTFEPDGEHVASMSDCTFKSGEKITFENCGNFDSYVWKIVGISGDNVTFKIADNSNVVGLTNLSPNGQAYSVEDQCPPAPFATWAGNRLIVPTGVDELHISSSLSTHDFPITNRLVIGGGESGNVTALEPLSDDSLLVFKNHSIYAVSGVYEMKGADQGGRLDINRITNQLGCIARKTIQVIGDEVVFLSPQGIYALALNTKGQGAVGLPPQAIRVADIPLSRDIDDQVANLNQEDSSGVFYRGRYYLFDGTETCYVYSTLLSAWESIDTIPTGVIKLLNINRGQAQLIFLSTKDAILQGEANPVGADNYLGATSSFESSITTRGYRGKSFDNKHFRRCQITWDGLDSDNSLEVVSEIENPYSQDTLVNLENIGIGSLNSRANLRKKGQSITLKISNNNNGRIKIKRTMIEATAGSRQNNKL